MASSSAQKRCRREDSSLAFAFVADEALGDARLLGDAIEQHCARAVFLLGADSGAEAAAHGFGNCEALVLLLTQGVLHDLRTLVSL